MITSDQYSKFCKGISANNKIIGECIETRDAMYKDLAESIKEVFFNHFHKTPSVEYLEKGELIKVRVPLNYGESITLTDQLLLDLMMPVTISIDYDSDAELDILVFELYPELNDDLGGDS